LDDGYEARLLTFGQIKESVPVFATFLAEVAALYPEAPEKLQFNEVIRRMLDRWVGDLIRNTQAQVAGGHAGLNVGHAVQLRDIRFFPQRLVSLSPEAESERRQTKEFLHQNLYFCSALEPEKEAAERIITNLFEFWMNAPEKLPPSYREKADAEPLPRIICDYIAGMTDTYISEQYEKFCGA